MDEFEHYTPGAKRGILAMRALTETALLALARSNGFALQRGEGNAVAQQAYADVLAQTGPGTNPTWVTGGAADEAYAKGLIDEVEYDFLVR